MFKPFRVGLSVLLGAFGAAAPVFAQDLVPPSVAVVSPADNSYRNSLVSITGTAFDSSGISDVQLSIRRVSDGYYWDGAAFAAAQSWLTTSVSSLTWSYSTPPAWLNGASYSISARALDMSSNWSTVYSTAVFHYDIGLPVSGVTAPLDGSSVSNFAAISGTAWDAESFPAQVWVKIDRASDSYYWNGATAQWTAGEVWNLAVGSATWTYSGLPEAVLAPGSTYFAVSRAADLSGNVEGANLAGSTFVYMGAAVGAGFTGDFSQPGGAVFDGGADDEANAVAVDTVSVGGPYVYSVGYSSGGANGTDWLVAKYDPSGVMLASATFNRGGGGTAQGVAVDPGGDIYIAGVAYNGVAFDSVLLKYGSALVLKSSAVFEGDSAGSGVAVDGAGKIYLVGSWYNGSSYGAVVSKYNSNLVYESSDVFSGMFGQGVSVGPDGNVYVIGRPSSGPTSYITLKYSSSLVLQSSATASFGTDSYPLGVAAGPNGEVYVTGMVYSGPSSMGVTVKYDSNLLLVSSAVASFGAGDNTGGSAVAVDGAGSVYVAGVSYNGVTNDSVVAKYNSNLIFLASSTYDSGYDDRAYGVAAGIGGDVYTAGMSSGASGSDFRTIRSMLPQAPASLGDLAAFPGSYVGSLGLSWGAPGNDGYSGTLDSGSVFYVQYATSPSVSWSTAAAQVAQSTSGVSAASPVSYKIGGLDPGTTYYLAVWHKDEAGHLSGISNIASAYAKPFPPVAMNRTVGGDGNWHVDFPASANPNTVGLAEDTSGSIYIAGTLSSGANDDLFLYKYDASGNLVLAKYFNGEDDLPDSAYSEVAVDPVSGAVYLAGIESRTSPSSVGLLIKYDASGQMVWKRRAQGNSVTEGQGIYTVKVDTAGDVYVGGNVSNGGDRDSFVRKYNPAGDMLWSSTKAYAANYDWVNDLEVKGGSVYAAGSADMSSFGQGQNATLWKLDANTGLTQWTTYYTGAANWNDDANGVVVDSSGSIYLAGSEDVSPGDHALLLQKRNPEGAVQWAKLENYTVGTADAYVKVILSTDNYLYLGAYVVRAPNGRDYMVSKRDLDGNLLGAYFYDKAGENDEANNLLLSGGKLIVSGFETTGGLARHFVRQLNLSDLTLPDTAPSEPVIIQPPHNSVVNSLPQLSGTAIDDISVSSVVVSILRASDGLFWDGAAWAASRAWLTAATTGYTWAYSAVPAWVNASTYTVNARAMDSVGNWSSGYSTSTFVFDNALPAGCEQVFNVKQDGSREYLGIQAALAALPQSLSGDACVVLRDTGTYSEQVTVRNFDNNGYRIMIMADPSFVSSAPVVSPPVFSTAAFQLFNDSVTVQGINIISTSAVTYGVLSSSADVTLSSVNVVSGGNIFSAGIYLSSRSAVSDSFVSVQDAYGLLLQGDSGSVSRSTVTGGGASYSAMFLYGASSSAVRGSFLSNPGGRAVYISSGAHNNTIGQSVITSNSNAALMFAALYLRDAYANTVEDTVISNPAGVAAYLGLNADRNTLSRSTMTSVSTGYQALRISGGAYNTVDLSFMSTPAGYGLYIGLNSGTEHNVISRSTVASNSAALSAVYIYLASSNTVTGSVISNPAGNGAYLWDASNGNTFSYSTITSSAAGKYAMLFYDVSSNTVEQCYLGNPPGYGAGFTGGSNYNSMSRSTVSVNSAYAALSIDNSVFNTVARSNISNPSGYGGLIGFGADNNTISYNSLAVNASNYFALKLQSVSYNTVSNNFISNPSGVAYTSVFGYGNVLAYSTVTSGAWAYSAAFIDASDYERVENSYVRGANALFIRDSTGTVVSYNVLAATNTAGTGLRLDTSRDSASAFNAVSAPGTGILLNAGNSGVTSITSDTVRSAAYGLSAGAPAAGGSLAVSGVSFEAMAPGSTAIKFLGGNLVSTITLASFNSTNTAVNVNGSLLSPGSAVTMRDYYGPRAGAAYETDPGGYVFWSVEDTAAPAAAVLQPADGAILNALPQLAGTSTDNVAVSSAVVSIFRQDTGLFWDGAAWSAVQTWLDAAVAGYAWTYSSVPAWVDGSSYAVSARVMDSSGNWSVPAASVFTYDVTAPLSAVLQPAAGQSSTFTYVSGTASDALGVAQVRVGIERVADSAWWSGGGWISTQAWNLASGTTAWLYAGIDSSALDGGATYQFMAKAFDAAGNVSDFFLAPSTFNFMIPPEGVFSSAPLSGIGPAVLTVNWGTSFPAGKLYYVRLSSHSVSSPYVAFATTTASAYAFAGLTPNSRYYGFVSTTAASGYMAAGSGITKAAAPAAASFSAVAYSSAALSWSSGGNPAVTAYQYEVAVSSMFLVVASSGSGTGTGGWLYGLEQGTTYYGRVRAYNAEGEPTAYAAAAVPAVTMRLVPSGAAAGLVGTAPGTTSINWTWTAGTLALADYFAVYYDGVLSSTSVFTASGAGTQAGLTPNTSHFLGISGRNAYGEGVVAISSPVYTRAAVPSGLAAQVALSSAVLSWGLNGNSAGTVAQLWRSADNMIFSSVYEGPALAYTDSGIEECSAYYYRARNRNGAGIYTAFGGTINFATQASTPAAPSGLYAEALNGARIALNWNFSPWPGVTQYNLYYDSATGSIDYGAPYAVFSATVPAWTTPELSAGSSYKFALRAVNRCGIEEKNATAVSAQAVGILSGVRAAIKSPQTGKKIKGNSVTVVGEIILGLPSQIKQVRFQYRLQGAGSWTDIAAANANHPNPDTVSPYFTHWDADAMAPGTYELRALATDVFNTDDAAPPTITVIIDAAEYDTNESVVAGAQQKEEKISNAVTSTVQAADEATALVSKVVIPAGAVDVTTVAITLVSNPPSKPVPPEGSEELSLAVKINLSSGQSLLAGGKTAAVTLSYKDDNGDGIVDGTNAPVDRLRMYSAPDGGGDWTEMATSVDREKKTISGVTTHFSFFSVFASPSATLSGIKVYPVPWQPGSGGRFDSAAGITFANVPSGARIKIFTIMGELVKALDVTAADANTKVWDGRNTDGHKAASGVYLVRVKSGSSEKTLKLAVER